MSYMRPGVASLVTVCLCLVRMGSLHAQENQAQGATPIQIGAIVVEGNSRMATASILGSFGLQAGSEATFREIQRGIKNLYSTGQFSDVKVFAEGAEGEPVSLTVRVEEQPVVRRLRISGLKHMSEGSVRDTTGLKTGQPFSPRRVFKAKEFIRDKLAKEGIPYARIEERTEPVEGDPGTVDFFLDVEEGNRLTVAQLDVRGNEGVSDGEIEAAMQTKREGFLWFKDGTYEADVFDQDLTLSIPDLYKSKGYLDVQIVSDSLVVDPQTGKTRIELQIDEGPRYRLADFSVRGNRHFSTEEVEQFFHRQAGGILRALGIGGGENQTEHPYFDSQAFEESLANLQQAYFNDGYIYAQITPWIERVDTAAGEEPAVRAGWNIVEDNPAYVRMVSIAGNDYTHERVIREKIYVLPGDVYNMDQVLRSYQSIAALGFFETPLDQPDIVPVGETGEVDITFKVKERQTGSINFGTAVGGGTGVSGFLGYDQPNLFGQAKEGHLRWDFGQYINSFTVSFTDPALFDSRISGSISLFDSRDRFFQFATGRRRRQGFSTRFGFPFPGTLRTQVFFGYSLARTEYRLYQDVDDTSLFGLPPGTQSTFSLGIIRNNLNHPLFPTAGSRQSWTTELNGGILGGDGNFTRHLAEASWYVPAGQVGGGGQGGRPIRLTFGLTLRGGAVFGDVSNFPFDRFWMGGVQFGEQLRGYDETSITPLGYFPERSTGISDIQRLGNAYLSMTAEYAIRVSDMLSLSAFFDAGNVWADPKSVDPTRLFRGAGLGIQLVTPFGPVGLDYAYGFDKTNPGWQLHFRMGAGY